MTTRPPSHEDEHYSRYTVKTPYGTFYVCARCAADHFPRFPQPRKHPLHDTTGCQCEDRSHFATQVSAQAEGGAR